MGMRGVQRLTDGGGVSLSALARGFECSRETVRKLLIAAGVQPTDEVAGNPVYPLVPCLLAMRAESRQGSDAVVTAEDAAKLAPADRKAWFASEKDRLQVAQAQGELVDVQDAREQLAALVKILASACDSIPDDLERELRLTPATVALIEAKLDALRDQIAGRLEAAA